ncbi:MAG: hypothetical protein CYG59_17780 [Chloroflexi bacterium]|nr:MAG: hypothetical protein CYG59_17780 [Chloroflexota bacterium]
MSTASKVRLNVVRQAVLELPPSVIEMVARAIENVPTSDWNALRQRAEAAGGSPSGRALIRKLIDRWYSEAPDISPHSFAFALLAATGTADYLRKSQTVEVVWTGPDSDLPLRHTAQVLQQVIREARNSLLVVSYAVYDIPEIVQVLADALNRGVHLSLVIEAPEEQIGHAAYNTLAAFGPHVSQRATVYRWPQELRPMHPTSHKPAALHVKCAVADGEALLLSSANLTHYALNLNMEMGVLIRGGRLPRQVVKHFVWLMEQQILVPV